MHDNHKNWHDLDKKKNNVNPICTYRIIFFYFVFTNIFIAFLEIYVYKAMLLDLCSMRLCSMKDELFRNRKRCTKKNILNSIQDGKLKWVWCKWVWRLMSTMLCPEIIQHNIKVLTTCARFVFLPNASFFEFQIIKHLLKICII